MRAQEFDNPKETFVDMFRKFLPIAMEVIGLDSLPRMVFEKEVESPDQPTFGQYVNNEHILHVGLANRHPNDILRTMAHELVHYKQDIEHKLNDMSGSTGSPEENEAHALAGIVMRHFNKRYPEYLKVKPVIAETWSEKYKRSINCSNPKGFSQRAHCQGRKKNESAGDRGDIPTGPQPQLIPFPKGTTMVDVSDVYDWYKLGMVISDLDDADPKIFGQGAPHTVIAFGSEEEEHKLLPLLKRLGLKVHDIDQPEDVKQAIPAKMFAKDLAETIRKVGSQYRLVSHTGKNLGTYPSKAGAEKRERQVQYFKHVGEDESFDKAANEYEAYLKRTKDQIMRFLAGVRGAPNDEEMLKAIDIAVEVMRRTGDIKQAAKAKKDYLYNISQNKQGVAEGSLEEVDTRTLVNYVPKAGRTLASLPPEERKRRSGMMTRAYQKLIPRSDFSDEIKKYHDEKNKKQGMAEEDDPLQARADYAARHGQGQVYKTHYPSGDNPYHNAGKKDPRGTKMYAYDIKRTGPKGKLPKEGVAENFADSLDDDKINLILTKLCKLVLDQRKENSDLYGWVGACVLDENDNIVMSTSTKDNDKWRHAERNAIDKYIKKYGNISEDSIIITTCSPCNESMKDRYGESCTDLINEIGIKTVYSGFTDPTQDEHQRQFEIVDSGDEKIKQLCRKFADKFLDLNENFADGRNPQDKGDSARHGIRKGMTIAQLKKVRSSDSASPRKKQLAHWQINMRQGRKK